MSDEQTGGKYDALCERVFAETKAAGVVLIVIDGNLGAGFSVVGTLDVLQGLPEHMRRLADGVQERYDKHPGGFLGYIVDKCPPSARDEKQ